MTRGPARPVGVITRGTTNPNRLRRVDRWLAAELGPALRRTPDPLVVDLGYGATAITTIELEQRLSAGVPGVRVVGVEIDPERVALARQQYPHARFERGGFELGPLHGQVHVVRACNVLRQYDEDQVPAAWASMAAACVPGGTVIDGTCDELGRVASWIRVQDGAPVSLTLSLRLSGLERPGVVAARLPKALIHHNVPGTGIGRLLQALDAGWAAAAPWSDFGARQRWLRTVAALPGFHVLDGPARWRLGEVTVAWSDVAPG